MHLAVTVLEGDSVRDTGSPPSPRPGPSPSVPHSPAHVQDVPLTSGFTNLRTFTFLAVEPPPWKGQAHLNSHFFLLSLSSLVKTTEEEPRLLRRGRLP